MANSAIIFITARFGKRAVQWNIIKLLGLTLRVHAGPRAVQGHADTTRLVSATSGKNNSTNRTRSAMSARLACASGAPTKGIVRVRASCVFIKFYWSIRDVKTKTRDTRPQERGILQRQGAASLLVPPLLTAVALACPAAKPPGRVPSHRVGPRHVM